MLIHLLLLCVFWVIHLYVLLKYLSLLLVVFFVLRYISSDISRANVSYIYCFHSIYFFLPLIFSILFLKDIPETEDIVESIFQVFWLWILIRGFHQFIFNTIINLLDLGLLFHCFLFAPFIVYTSFPAFFGANLCVCVLSLIILASQMHLFAFFCVCFRNYNIQPLLCDMLLRVNILALQKKINKLWSRIVPLTHKHFLYCSYRSM